MAITIQYTRTQLESIRYVLKDSWENIVSQVMYSPKSLLRLIDVGKLCRIDTRIIRKDMERARFDELYIASLQNRKRMLSNDRARPRYNRRRREVKRLTGIAEKLRKEKRDLEDIILKYRLSMTLRQLNS